MSTRGARAASVRWTSRNSCSSSRQSTHTSTCASTTARALASSRSCSRSGSWSRITAFVQSFIEKLLHSAHRVVVMHPGGSFRRADRLGDLLVRQSFVHPQRENFLLCRRQLVDRGSQTLLCLVGDHGVERIVFRGRVGFLNLGAVASSLLGAPPIEEQPPLDREQPG